MRAAAAGHFGWMRHPMSMLLVGATAAVLLLLPIQNMLTVGPAPAEQIVSDLVRNGTLNNAIRELLSENPDILVSALALFQQRQTESQQRHNNAQQQNLRAVIRSRELLDETIVPVAGNPNGDVTIVEFMDYQCGFCKRIHPMLQRLLAEDGNVKLIYKELPILGPASVYAARAALAARAQDSYGVFHDALMESRVRLSEPVVLRLAAGVGLDVGQLQQDMAANEAEHQTIFAQSQDLARAFNLQGTPSFVIDGAFIGGMIDEATMRRLIDDARRT